MTQQNSLIIPVTKPNALDSQHLSATRSKNKRRHVPHRKNLKLSIVDKNGTTQPGERLCKHALSVEWSIERSGKNDEERRSRRRRGDRYSFCTRARARKRAIGSCTRRRAQKQTGVVTRVNCTVEFAACGAIFAGFNWWLAIVFGGFNAVDYYYGVEDLLILV